MHVVFPYRKIQFTGFIQYILAESLIRFILDVGTMCNFCHVRLQFEIPGINRGKQDSKPEQRGEDRNRSRDTPSGNGVHERSDSLPGAVSSAQISSECGVHSADDMPEMCRSSSRSVPWP